MYGARGSFAHQLVSPCARVNSADESLQSLVGRVESALALNLGGSVSHAAPWLHSRSREPLGLSHQRLNSKGAGLPGPAVRSGSHHYVFGREAQVTLVFCDIAPNEMPRQMRFWLRVLRNISILVDLSGLVSHETHPVARRVFLLLRKSLGRCTHGVRGAHRFALVKEQFGRELLCGALTFAFL